MIELCPLTERSWLARFPDEASARRWALVVRASGWPELEDVVLAYRSVAVFTDVDRLDSSSEFPERLRSVPFPPIEAVRPGRLHTIPVLYDGPDLEDVAGRLGRDVSRVIELHAGRDYEVFAVGFLPGFPYCGYLDPALSGLPRRDSPRVRVPAGSVALAARQTGIYPQESPGGWHLLGRTPIRIVDLDAPRFPISAGDSVRFEPIDSKTYDVLNGTFL